MMDHCETGPDECFGCKMEYWRERPPTVKIPKGWKGPSLNARANKMVEEARKEGLDPVNVGNRWV